MKRDILRVISLMLLGLALVWTGCSDEAGVDKNNGKNNGGLDGGSDASTSDPKDTRVDEDTKKGSDTGDKVDGGKDSDANDPPPGKSCMNQYHRVCDDECVNVKVDPDNCGACGTKCGSGEACSGGACAQSCGKNEQICDRQCVDTKSDSNHCGGCGISCEAGKGCNGGQCVPSLDLTDGVNCEDGGPVIDIDWGGGQDRCSGAVAEAAFRWAVCSCNSVTATGGVTTDAFDSTLGPYIPGALGGGVGINGSLVGTSPLSIGGALWVSDTGQALNASGKVGIDLKVGGNGLFTSEFDVGGDAALGSFLAVKPFTVGGTLTVPAGGAMNGEATYGNLVRAPVNVPEPCACDEEDLVPIAALVEARRTNNDNALIGLDVNAFNRVAPMGRVDLPCGNFYLDGISASREMTIVAHGRTALYIKGNISGMGSLTIKAMPSAELDVFVDGEFIQTGPLIFGSQHYPAATRLYIGGANGFVLTENADIGGFLYVYPGTFVATDHVDVFGGVFGNQLVVTSPLTVHYDRQIQRVGDSCPGSDPGTDPGPGPGN